MTKPAILFVCLGNICRSPLAEAALRAEAERAGIHLSVDSAGTGHWHVGEPPDARAQAIALRHGIDISDLRARQATREDFRRFTHIYALDSDNFEVLAGLRPADASAGLALLLDCVAGREGQAVRDPYYGGEEGFDATWDDVTTAARALVARFR